MAVIAEDGMDGRIDGRTNWRDWSPVIALVVGFLGVIVSILAVGMAILGAVDRARAQIGGVRTEIGVVRTELKAEIGVVGGRVDELAAGQAEIRERLARVKAQLEILSGEWPPARRGSAGE